MGRILKYNGVKSSDSRRNNGKILNGTSIGIPTNTTTSSSVTGDSSVNNSNLNRVIWGQIDTGKDIESDFLVGGNGFILDTVNDDPKRTLIDMSDMFGEDNEGNLYVEKWVKAKDIEVKDTLNAENVSANNLEASEISGDNANISNIYTDFLNAVSGFIKDLNGEKLNFIEGVIKELVSTNITTEYLTVTKQAHFFELIIDKIKSAGGAVILSPADGFKIDKVEIANNSPRYYNLLWKTNDGDKAIENMWEVGDQALCQTFNLAKMGSVGKETENRIFAFTGGWFMDDPTGQYQLDVGLEERPDTSKKYKIVIQDVRGRNEVIDDCTVILDNQDKNTYHFLYEGRGVLTYAWSYDYLYYMYNGVIDEDLSSAQEAEDHLPSRIEIYEKVAGGFSNKYYWTLVNAKGTRVIDDVEYHYIQVAGNDVYNTGKFDGEVNPEVGDEIAMLGHRGDDEARKSAIYISAYASKDETLKAPLFCHYKGIDDFNLSSHKFTWFAANGNTIRGNLLVDSGKSVEEISNSIVRTTVEYAVSSSGTTAPSTNWTTTIPSVPAGRYLWTRTTIEYSNGQKSVSYSVSRNGSNGTNGSDYSPNLLLGTKDFSGNNWWMSQDIEDELTEKRNGCDIKIFHGAGQINYETKIDRNKSYTFSVDVEISDGMGIILDINRQEIYEEYDFDSFDEGWAKIVYQFDGDELRSENLSIYLTATHYGLTRGPIKTACWKLEEGLNNNPVWTPAASEMVGEDGERGEPAIVYSLIPINEYAQIDEFGSLHLNLEYNLVKIEGDEITPIKPSDANLKVFWHDDTDDELFNFKDDYKLVVKDDDYLGRVYNRQTDPTMFTVIMRKYTDDDEWFDAERRQIPVQFKPYAILEVNESIRTEVRDIEGRTSSLEQTADKFEFDIYDPDGHIGSQIEQTAERIKLQVDEINLQINNKKIILNGDTEINGTLVLNDEEQGFILSTNNGTTQISPKSVFPYVMGEEPTNQTIKFENNSNGTTSAIGTFAVEFTHNLGYFKANFYLQFKDFKINFHVDNQTSKDDFSYSTTVWLYCDDKELATYNFGNLNSIWDLLNYTTYLEGNYSLKMRCTCTCTSLPNKNCKTDISYTLTHPTGETYMLIGTDGIVMNFANNTNIAMSRQGFVASFGDTRVRVTQQGFYKYTGYMNSYNAPLPGSEDTAWSRYANNWCRVGGAVRIINSPGNIYVNDNDDIFRVDISTTVATNGKVHIYLPGAGAEIGRRIVLIRDDDNTEVTVHTANVLYDYIEYDKCVNSTTVVNHNQTKEFVINQKRCVEFINCGSHWHVIGILPYNTV